MKTFLLAVSASLLLAACGDSADAYLGKWQHMKNEKETVEIVRNGDTYLLKQTAPSIFDGKLATKSVPAVMKDGLMQINAGLGPVTIGHIKSSDTLTVPGMMGNTHEYKRMK